VIMGQPLETYRKKRDFTLTSEPRGKSARAKGDLFVVQKHDARRLHYDFRLEMDGVLKSWAVTRGPSLVPGEKRLAVHVEDHPLEYAGFEGTIPKGEYGGGTVIVWDTGRWKSTGDAHKQYKKGHLEFELTGEKLKGRWHLVRMHGKPGEKRENWLLIKGEDDFAREPDEPDILEEKPESVKTGRVIADVEDEEPGWSSKTGRIKTKPATAKKPAASRPTNGQKRAMPDFIEPELATLVPAAPEGDRWLHEIKFDGYRVQAHVAQGEVKLYSRGGLDWTEKFGQQIVADLVGTGVDEAIFDGEIVVENQSGLSDFSALQEDLSEGRSDRFTYYLFDLLHVDGNDLRQTPLVERKKLLEKLLSKSSTLRFSEAFDADGAAVWENACGLGLEGIVSKLKDAAYRSGRSNDWRKSKCIGRQEFVIAGYVPSTATRGAIGSLLLGVQDKKGLVPVGRVGTGFSVKVAKELYKRLYAMRLDESPFAVPLTADERRGAKFVKPQLVAEIEFRAWTADKRLRHASFRGLREDKAASDVRWEEQNVPARVSDKDTQKIDVKLTHPDRVYWPGEGVTKQGLADYYAEVWPPIEPFIVNRPLALLRCPTGIEGEFFFQKHAWKGLNEHIVEVQDPKDKDEEPYISIRDFNGLIGLVQAGTLEIHPWGSTLKNWELPDTLTMDLDPGEGVSWPRVIEAATETRERLEKLGLTTFVKTSGGKGLHVVVPLKPKADWETLKSFTKAIADQMAADSPDRYVSTISKAKRKGKILIDYLRNQRGMTAVAPYSPRARPGAGVSMPLAWEEVTPAIGPAHFTILNTPTRLAALKSDPWQDFRSAETPLPKMKKQGG